MANNPLVDSLFRMNVHLGMNKIVNVTEHQIPQMISQSDLDLIKKTKFKKSFADLIPKFAGTIFNWNWTKPNGDMIIANCDIQKVKMICSDWKLYDDSMKGDPNCEPLKYFKIVDYLSENDAVGIYSGPYATNSLYYFEYDGVPRYLGLDLTGYIKMLQYTRWFENWPLALIIYKTNANINTLDFLKMYYPMIFKDISVEEILAKYDELFIEEKMPPGASWGY